jgi:hypothetical protein
MWIYVLGERDGGTVKIGHTKQELVADRGRSVNRDQMNGDTYVLLAAVRSTVTGENIAHRCFAEHRQARGSHKEYYDPADEIVEWVLWLRQQWFVTFADTDDWRNAFEAHPDDWVPKPGRREPRPPADPGRLVQDHVQLNGPLAGTAWDWMPDLTSSFQDYFTPPEIIRAAIVAMGGIDLDAASHWIANRRLHEEGVDVGEYFHTNKSSFSHDWLDRVWLNPPYGDNARWFERALEMMDSGRTSQLCMLSPVYVFTTAVAKPIMERSVAAVLLMPTPKFHNPGEPTKTGTNHPHAVVYWGERRLEFLRAYCPKFGMPLSSAWSDLEEVACA